MMESVIIFIFLASGFFAIVWLNERPHYPTLWEVAKATIAWATLNILLIGIFL